MAWATFWAIFSQTLLVTLLSTHQVAESHSHQSNVRSRLPDGIVTDQKLEFG
jgi:hypothetical protein